MMKMYWQFKIKALAEKATADNKRINGAMIKREYSIPYSAKTLVKYLKQYYKLPSKKTHRDQNSRRWNSLKKTLFTKVIEVSFTSTHKTIPVGAKTYQSDVETSHRLIEDEFYACRYFSSAQDFLKQAHQYQKHFNFTRFNTYKNGSPVQLLQQAAPHINRNVLNFKPVLVDTFFHLYKNEFRLLAS